MAGREDEGEGEGKGGGGKSVFDRQEQEMGMLTLVLFDLWGTLSLPGRLCNLISAGSERVFIEDGGHITQTDNQQH